MPTRDPIESAMDALVAYLATVFFAHDPPIVVKKGWPGEDDSFDLATGPALTVSAVGSVEEEACSPTDVDVDGSTVTYRVGYLTIPIQLDLWCAIRAQREDVGPEIVAALNNQLPYTSGLWIDSTNYFGRPLSIEPKGGKLFDDQQEPGAVGEWRRSWDLEAYTDQVLTRDLPVQSPITITATVDDVADDPITVTE